LLLAWSLVRKINFFLGAKRTIAKSIFLFILKKNEIKSVIVVCAEIFVLFLYFDKLIITQETISRRVLRAFTISLFHQKLLLLFLVNSIIWFLQFVCCCWFTSKKRNEVLKMNLHFISPTSNTNSRVPVFLLHVTTFL